MHTYTSPSFRSPTSYKRPKHSNYPTDLVSHSVNDLHKQCINEKLQQITSLSKTTSTEHQTTTRIHFTHRFIVSNTFNHTSVTPMRFFSKIRKREHKNKPTPSRRQTNNNNNNNDNNNSITDSNSTVGERERVST